MALHTRIALTTPATSTSAPTTSLGTILYSGPVPPTQGIWLGVEWDDPARGKHDGMYEKTSVRYFHCRIKGAGSFLRPNAPGLSYGTSFLAALHSKYLDDGSSTKEGEGEESTFYATSSNFEVEVVPLARIRERFKQLNRVREVGLEWEGVSGAGSTEEREEVRKELGSIEVLNLSYSLLPSLQAVDEVIVDLRKLRTLSLNSNRFAPLREPTLLAGFERLTTLNLNRTLMDWNELLLLSPSLPELQELQLGDNELASLSAETSPTEPLLPSLKTLNLDTNKLTNWDEIVASLLPLPSLDRLILSRNSISTVPLSPSSATLNLRYLSLTANALASWSSVDALNSQVPNLEGLWIGENPLFEGLHEGDVRLEIIARVKGLRELEGSRISPTEREDAEQWYLSRIGKSPASELEKEELHPRWKELVEKYGVSTKPTEKKSTAMKARLIQLKITLDDSFLPSTTTTTSPLSLSVLPTLRTLLLRTQIARLVGKPVPKTQWSLVAVLKSAEEGEEGLRVEIPATEEGREVSWWGLNEGDEVKVERRG
ncbi:hypothetical protein BCR35DRAFT_181638 [Leucosporidium creatinivorum]|uniref:CAP-Gly domain-containing protein n=1 Tax=Leucosporidium creatinivorum TaxID=106004 RepID=A0A1Y2E5R6_9BASI|nr:hypothetical protein BCR35DRAFT_181638 [Leucosporidium creatinivorum]